jgi:ABC-type Mn2+/Zn2+ transport system ATPase subunit
LTEIAKDVSDLGKIFFDDTMNITLLPGKESSNGVLKPSFDITVEYNGKTFEDIKVMSSGEKKRISIIMLMVLSKYAGGKMLLLDEALTSVGLEKRGIIAHELETCGLFTIISSHDDFVGYNHELILTKQMLD